MDIHCYQFLVMGMMGPLVVHLQLGMMVNRLYMVMGAWVNRLMAEENHCYQLMGSLVDPH